jgi:hypothetical protein
LQKYADPQKHIQTEEVERKLKIMKSSKKQSQTEKDKKTMES